MGPQEDETAFENEVRRVARWIYPNTAHQGSMQLLGRERDGIFVTDDLTIAVEATVSTTAGKAKYDATKLVEAISYLRENYPDRPSSGLFITQREPTNYQRKAVVDAAGPSVACMSLDTFRSRVIDSGEYLSCRDAAPFGSARNPLTNSTEEVGTYSPVDLLRVRDESLATLDSIYSEALDSKRLVILGDYGAGKSMTLRELYFRFATSYRTGEQYRQFPVYLNLREHHGQTSPTEALERHARNIGFSRPDKLVRAWRAGMCLLLLDGFDEIAPSSLAGVGRDPNSIRDLNYRSAELVRQFYRESPVSTGLIVAGRTQYFRSEEELRTAFDLEGSTDVLSLSDFTANQMKQYLVRQGWSTDVPRWLPGRPLLLGWLASRSFLAETIDIGHLSPASGWNWLLDAIFEREAKIEGGIDGRSLREVLERVATFARSTASGLGPIYLEDIRESFRSVLGYPPDDRQDVLLRRLPGLGVASAVTGSRNFIDSAMADVARAGDIARHVASPEGFALDSSDWHNLLDALGISVCADLVFEALRERSQGAVEYALKRAARSTSNYALAADLFDLATTFGVTSFEFPLVLRDLVIPEFHLGGEDTRFGTLSVEGCIIEDLLVSEVQDLKLLPSFSGCSILKVTGVNREEALPSVFFDCSFETFVDTETTTNTLVNMTMPQGVRLGLICLRKLYTQRGGSRHEASMTKGIPPEDRNAVKEVLKLLAAHGLATVTRHGATVLWQPVRAEDKHVRRWLADPKAVRGPVFDALASV